MAALGEIFWADLPATGGHEQAGARPVVIVQDDAALAGLPVVAVAPLTTNLASSRFPCTVVLQPDADNRLSRASVVLAFQVRTLDRRRLRERLGKLSPDDARSVEAAMRALLRLL